MRFSIRKDPVVERAAPAKTQAFRLKGTMPALSLLCLLTDDLEAIERQLVDHLSQMPQFFLHAPVVVDLDGLEPGKRADLKGLAELLRRNHLVPVAVRNPPEALKEEAVAGGWGILQNDLAATRPGAPRPAPREAGGERLSQVNTPLVPAVRDRSGSDVRRAPEAERQPGSITVYAPVRSGQVIYAVGSDLLVLAPVSAGAELIADGNIHVYAPLRGRALAGASGNTDVSIFCQRLEAEFLSVAGRYLMAEEISRSQRGKPARACLRDDQLTLLSL
jgi:septum site-determining protein MinC